MDKLFVLLLVALGVFVMWLMCRYRCSCRCTKRKESYESTDLHRPGEAVSLSDALEEHVAQISVFANNVVLGSPRDVNQSIIELRNNAEEIVRAMPPGLGKKWAPLFESYDNALTDYITIRFGKDVPDELRTTTPEAAWVRVQHAADGLSTAFTAGNDKKLVSDVMKSHIAVIRRFLDSLSITLNPEDGSYRQAVEDGILHAQELSKALKSVLPHYK